MRTFFCITIILLGSCCCCWAQVPKKTATRTVKKTLPLAVKPPTSNFWYLEKTARSAQEQHDWCWVASLQMIKKFHLPKGNISQCTIASTILSSSNCCSVTGTCNLVLLPNYTNLLNTLNIASLHPTPSAPNYKPPILSVHQQPVSLSQYPFSKIKNIITNQNSAKRRPLMLGIGYLENEVSHYMMVYGGETVADNTDYLLVHDPWNETTMGKRLVELRYFKDATILNLAIEKPTVLLNDSIATSVPIANTTISNTEKYLINTPYKKRMNVAAKTTLCSSPQNDCIPFDIFYLYQTAATPLPSVQSNPSFFELNLCQSNYSVRYGLINESWEPIAIFESDRPYCKQKVDVEKIINKDVVTIQQKEAKLKVLVNEKKIPFTKAVYLPDQTECLRFEIEGTSYIYPLINQFSPLKSEIYTEAKFIEVLQSYTPPPSKKGKDGFVFGLGEIDQN